MKRNIGAILFSVILISVITFPFLWLLLGSFKTMKELFSVPIRFFPEHISLDNYIAVFKAQPFGLYLYNSIVIALLGTVLVVVASAMASYSLARIPIKGKKLVLILVLTVSLLPPVTLAALAGAAYEKGENNNGKVLPVTMVFGVSGVDTKTFRDYIESHPEMTNPDTHGLKLPFRRAKADGKWPVERDGGAWKELTPTGEFTSLNLTLENGIDGTNVWDLTHAEIQGRQQVMWAVDVLRNYAKEMGFANCSLRSIAGQIGIRETRRIQGGYSICRRDVLGHSEFDDSIGVYTTFIDGEVVSKDDAHFQLPYRMILPNGIENLSVAGRCASCDDDAIQTVRMMVCCATTGQAAGTASALSIKDDVVLRDLDIHTLQNQLVADGVRIR